MILGCSTILYGGYDLDTALKGIRKAGYEAIELCAIPGMAPHISCDMSPNAAREVKAKVADYGLMIESIGASGNPFKAEGGGEAPFVKLMKVAAVNSPMRPRSRRWRKATLRWPGSRRIWG